MEKKLQILKENTTGFGILIENSNVACTVKKVLNEATNATDYTITGIYMQGDLINRNGRDYPFLKVMKPEVERYIREVINVGDAGMEFEHPDDLSLNGERVCGVVKKLWFDGSNVLGESAITNYGYGLLVRSLLDAQLRIGVSSRATGTVGSDNKVKNDFRLYYIDTVVSPSGINCYVDHVVNEAQEIVISQNLLTEQELESFQKIFKKLNPKDRAKNLELYNKVMNTIKYGKR